jgi:hypothetical protein
MNSIAVGSDKRRKIGIEEKRIKKIMRKSKTTRV